MLTIKVIEAKDDIHPEIDGVKNKDMLCALVRVVICTVLLRRIY